MELFNQQDGDEIPDGVSIADGQKWLAKPNGQLTDEQLLVKHRIKTPVMGALKGSKLGVQAKFAKEAARRMSPTLRAQLQGHLQLFALCHVLKVSLGVKIIGRNWRVAIARLCWDHKCKAMKALAETVFRLPNAHKHLTSISMP